ncbi:amidohydrolase family protein [Sphingomonas sp. AOB5]|uniref:amidohydrolase family protein n=1 Tax=Sphingomonas sp. AOB5 TaxID=3034017 RepID=UPI0023F79BAE|nr:amidohydrolase family protein [Sphingomonas sp. AOB5]MDF7776106.1 amidohydrolase family protein [Sphingomonas sp. AOB5]
MHVIDTHAHFWDVDTLHYPWIEKGSPFDRSFHLADYQRVSAEVPVRRMVFVECDAHARCSVAEAEWVAGLAQADPRIQGIVARVSFLDDEWEATLARLAAMPLVCGIRDNIQDKPAGFAVADRFVAGVRAVHARGLHFELCLKHHQIGETIELVRACPEGQFVLDHCAKPGIAAGLREPWLTGMRELAALPNVVCKISGLLTEADWENWVPDEILWYARASAEAFGPERILFGSDWPVSEVAGGYMVWFKLAQALAANWSEADRERFFWRNAERVYRLSGE